MNGKQRKLVGAIGFGVVFGLVIFALGGVFDGWDIGFERGLYGGLGAVFGYLTGWRDCLGNVAVQARRLRGVTGG